ncbi:CLUMA_CG014969, isoform A [Clunio marinus]|uniref:CLUMA_CG014969, isoform A n=1 Tax=Clunio marinus TaxID=568069 RepID=A0A1J1ITB9_9DIPT|nr:CLUMA_CG014969, isoform A [Clunio marinus]
MNLTLSEDKLLLLVISPIICMCDVNIDGDFCLRYIKTCKWPILCTHQIKSLQWLQKPCLIHNGVSWTDELEACLPKKGVFCKDMLRIRPRKNEISESTNNQSHSQRLRRLSLEHSMKD